MNFKFAAYNTCNRCVEFSKTYPVYLSDWLTFIANDIKDV